MINKIPVETTHLPAHPSSAGVTHVHTGALAAAISHNKSASVTYPVPSGASHRNQSLSLGRFHDGCLCLFAFTGYLFARRHKRSEEEDI